MSCAPSFREERQLITQGFNLIAGADEVGCGAWAGPVFAAAVILPIDSRIGSIRDSKLLTPNSRLLLSEQIKKRASAWSIGIATTEEIEILNIRQAALLAMRRAILSLQPAPEYVLSDAFFISGLSIPCKNLVKGDRYVKSIAAASIVAKVARDQFMTQLDEQFPFYGFGIHKGYGTKQHQIALAKFGPCRVHRKTYEPVANFLQKKS